MSRLLHETGEALYGPRWQTDLAADLNVAVRTMQRWAASAEDPPPGVYMDILRIAMERAQALDALVNRLRGAASPEGTPDTEDGRDD